jgi:hypothetical protein
MFLARRPSLEVIDRFLRDSNDLPLSYGPIGLVRSGIDGSTFDEELSVIGRGGADASGARFRRDSAVAMTRATRDAR